MDPHRGTVGPTLPFEAEGFREAPLGRTPISAHSSEVKSSFQRGVHTDIVQLECDIR